MRSLDFISSKDFKLVLLYSATMFVSAFLLFLVQPMFGKIILPLLGGAPSVWNGCMLFYQTLLLLGYLYAHFLGRYFDLKGQVLIHTVLLLFSLFSLPVGLSGWLPAGGGNPVLWLLGALFLAVGIPFFVVSSTSPLIQRWFSLSNHKDAPDPYFLYASSNIGSMLGLLSYPIYFESHFGVLVQTHFWSYLYFILCLSLVICGYFILKIKEIDFKDIFLLKEVSFLKPHINQNLSKAPSLLLRFRWLLLAFCPSALMLAVTTYITTDLAAAPFLWVIPLALYLLSFILVFAKITSRFHKVWVHFHLYIFLLFICFYISDFHKVDSMPLLHLAAFFLATMVCHGELAKSRPHADRLTEFYLFMSVGGALGGLFSAVIAPMVFDWVAEYPILIVLSLLLRPGNFLNNFDRRKIRYDIVVPIAFLFIIMGLILYGQEIDRLNPKIMIYFVFFVIGGSVAFRRRPVRLGLTIAGMMFCGLGLSGRHDFFNVYERSTIMKDRSFFGVITVNFTKNSVGSFHSLHHGTTLHGAQALDQKWAKEPLTYYTKSGPLGQLFRAFDGVDDKWNIALVGLGTGTTACYAKPHQNWTYYEIDPMIVKMNKEAKYFTYLKDCSPDANIILGDARLSMKDANPKEYNLIILDAFSSDSIPAHLLTKEAIEMYFDKLADGGLLAFHISNRYLRLEPVLANIAKAKKYTAAVLSITVSLRERMMMKSSSQWVVLGKDFKDVEPLFFEGDWTLADTDKKIGVWTDDFSNLMKIIYMPDSKLYANFLKIFGFDNSIK